MTAAVDSEPQLVSYAGLKRELEATAAQLGGVLDGMRAPLQQRLASVADRLARDRFHLAVLGQ
ncbi:MAG TPA: hypothetical protein VN812_22125, partial [Candidatus Acidoferrales bacterium]|nr:hypothetical protein [Candidatus Acidoferrales bacterium]